MLTNRARGGTIDEDVPGSSVRVGLKVCGITEPGEIDALAANAVDWVGLWHAVPGGPAELPAERWRLLAEAAATRRVSPVLVTFSKDAAALANLLAASGARWVQLHAYQTPGMVRAIKKIDPEAQVIKVLHARGSACVEEKLVGLYEKAGTDLFLLDAVSSDGRIGSTGETLDPAYAAALADKLNLPFLLAGGISPESRDRFEAVASHPLFRGIDVDTNARGADGKVAAEKVAAISRAWRGRA